jgi:nitroreductase
MEFADVVRRRKMVRTFRDAPVDPAVVDRILDRARRAPSAGFSQGVEFLVLDQPEQVDAFWSAVRTPDETEWPRDGVRRPPVLIIPAAGKHVYLDRYAENDKGWDDRDEAHWPVPYWTVDTAFAAMVILLAAVDEGLGALFFGLEGDGYERMRGAFGMPDAWAPIGVIALGHAAERDPVKSSASSRARRPLTEVVHRGAW